VIELDSELGPNWDQNMPVKALNEFEVLIRWPVPLAPPHGGSGMLVETV
jgi:hypothetical protein